MSLQELSRDLSLESLRDLEDLRRRIEVQPSERLAERECQQLLISLFSVTVALQTLAFTLPSHAIEPLTTRRSAQNDYDSLEYLSAAVFGKSVNALKLDYCTVSQIHDSVFFELKRTDIFDSQADLRETFAQFATDAKTARFLYCSPVVTLAQQSGAFGRMSLGERQNFLQQCLLTAGYAKSTGSVRM